MKITAILIGNKIITFNHMGRLPKVQKGIANRLRIMPPRTVAVPNPDGFAFGSMTSMTNDVELSENSLSNIGDKKAMTMRIDENTHK